MPATVMMSDVLSELKGLSGSYPTVSVNSRTKLFFAQTNLMFTNARRGRYEYVTGTADSADLAILLAYQSIFEVPRGVWLESESTLTQWVYDPSSDGWMLGTGLI